RGRRWFRISPKWNYRKFRIILGVVGIKYFAHGRGRIQQRIKSAELHILKEEQENKLPNFPSFIPFLPPLTCANLKQHYATCFSLIAGIILFGGLLAPTPELKLGLGGTSYADFISMHLRMQLSEVDPIVASFSGGAVGEHKRCKYCLGTGYLACARCSSTGSLVSYGASLHTKRGEPHLQFFSFALTMVMCPTCLCRGMAMASEHDPRIDPFD
ncbi:ORANGE, chloroplastic, partial [Olea europaea subsp. europaea]